jgi:hypothetical protein
MSADMLYPLLQRKGEMCAQKIHSRLRMTTYMSIEANSFVAVRDAYTPVDEYAFVASG